jgi:single-stranded DNA-binding protein
VEEWTDKDNRSRYTLEVHATDMQFIGGKGDESVRASTHSAPDTREADISDDDIPF